MLSIPSRLTVLALIGILAVSRQGHAETHELSASVATGRLINDFSVAGPLKVHLLQYRGVPDLQANLFGESLRSQFSLGVDLLAASQKIEDSKFPFNNGEHITFKGIFFIPTVCVFVVPLAKVCFGIGQGTLNVNSAKNRQDYGTWTYQADWQWQLTDLFFLKAISKFVGEVEHRVDSENAKFSLLMHGLGVGLQIP